MNSLDSKQITQLVMQWLIKSKAPLITTNLQLEPVLICQKLLTPSKGSISGQLLFLLAIY